MALFLRAGRPVECDRMATFADGLAVRVAIPEAVALVNGVVDRMLTGLRARRWRKRSARFTAPESAPRAPRPRASPRCRSFRFSRRGPVVLVVTGRNIDDALHRRAVEDPGSFPD